MNPPVYVRRTGIAFLSLVLVTNPLPWMALLLWNPWVSGDALSAGQPVAGIGGCLAAIWLVAAAWFVGRRLPDALAPRIPRPRDTGLVFAIAAAALNLALAGSIRWGAARSAWPLATQVWVFGGIWYLAILPTQIIAAFCKGRASIPFAKAAVPRVVQTGP